jgi:hypothetical protein
MSLADHEVATAVEIEDRGQDVFQVGSLVDQRSGRTGLEILGRLPPGDDRPRSGVLT